MGLSFYFWLKACRGEPTDFLLVKEKTRKAHHHQADTQGDGFQSWGSKDWLSPPGPRAVARDVCVHLLDLHTTFCEGECLEVQGGSLPAPSPFYCWDLLQARNARGQLHIFQTETQTHLTGPPSAPTARALHSSALPVSFLWGLNMHLAYTLKFLDFQFSR